MFARLDVPDFCGNRDPDTYLDWVHSIEVYFRWYEMLESYRLQFVEVKLKGTTLMWWQQYKESYARADLGTMSTQDEMKAAMNKRFKPQDYRQRTHIQLTRLRQETMTVKAYTSKFQHLATKAGTKWNDEILVSLYRQGLQPHISQGLSYHYYTYVDDVIQVAYQIEEDMQMHYTRRLKV